MSSSAPFSPFSSSESESESECVGGGSSWERLEEESLRRVRSWGAGGTAEALLPLLFSTQEPFPHAPAVQGAAAFLAAHKKGNSAMDSTLPPALWGQSLATEPSKRSSDQILGLAKMPQNSSTK